MFSRWRYQGWRLCGFLVERLHRIFPYTQPIKFNFSSRTFFRERLSDNYLYTIFLDSAISKLQSPTAITRNSAELRNKYCICKLFVDSTSIRHQRRDVNFQQIKKDRLGNLSITQILRVGATGFEPATQCSQSTRSANCDSRPNKQVRLQLISCYNRDVFESQYRIHIQQGIAQLFK